MKRLTVVLLALALNWSLVQTVVNDGPSQILAPEGRVVTVNVMVPNEVYASDNNNLIFLPLMRKSLPPPGPFNKLNPTNQEKELTYLYLQWSPSQGAASYEYCLDEINDNICNTSWQPSTLTYAYSANYKDSTWYYWQVRALNAEGVDIYADNGAWWSFQTVVFPKPGFWWDANTGTYFFVNQDQVREFSIYAYLPQCNFNGWITYPYGDIPIMYGTIQSGHDFNVIGVFDTNSTVSGNVTLSQFPYCGYSWNGSLNWNAVWIDDSQPTSVSPTAQEVISQQYKAFHRPDIFLISPRK